MIDYKKITLCSIVVIALGIGIYYTSMSKKPIEKDENLDEETKQVDKSDYK